MVTKSEWLASRCPGQSGTPNPGALVTRLRLMAKDLRAEGFPGAADLAKEAADTVESMAALLADPDIVKVN